MNKINTIRTNGVDYPIPAYIELTECNKKDDVLPLGGVYYWNGEPTHSVVGKTEYHDSVFPFIAFCYEHEEASGYGPRNHTVLVYVASSTTKKEYTYSHTFNTDSPYIGKTFEARLDENIIKALNMNRSSKNEDGVMSMKDYALLHEGTARIIDLKDYVDKSIALPTLGATFLYLGNTTHCRTIYDAYGEVVDDGEYFHVFCCMHDAEETGGKAIGYIYIVYDANLGFYRKYRRGEGDIPLIITQAFGEGDTFFAHYDLTVNKPLPVRLHLKNGQYDTTADKQCWYGQYDCYVGTPRVGNYLLTISVKKTYPGATVTVADKEYPLKDGKEVSIPFKNKQKLDFYLSTWVWFNSIEVNEDQISILTNEVKNLQKGINVEDEHVTLEGSKLRWNETYDGSKQTELVRYTYYIDTPQYSGTFYPKKLRAKKGSTIHFNRMEEDSDSGLLIITCDGGTLLAEFKDAMDADYVATEDISFYVGIIGQFDNISKINSGHVIYTPPRGYLKHIHDLSGTELRLSTEATRKSKEDGISFWNIESLIKVMRQGFRLKMEARDPIHGAKMTHEIKTSHSAMTLSTFGRMVMTVKDWFLKAPYGIKWIMGYGAKFSIYHPGNMSNGNALLEVSSDNAIIRAGQRIFLKAQQSFLELHEYVTRLVTRNDLALFSEGALKISNEGGAHLKIWHYGHPDESVHLHKTTKMTLSTNRAVFGINHGEYPDSDCSDWIDYGFIVNSDGVRLIEDGEVKPLGLDVKGDVISRGAGANAVGYANGPKIIASGRGSFAGGIVDDVEEHIDIVSSGDGSFAFGRSTIASADYSCAIGYKAKASGDSSFAHGFDSTAKGRFSFAESNSSAEGYCSHSEGSRTIATKYCQHVQGAYNVKDTKGSTTSFSATSDALIIGNGVTDSNRSNAFRVTFDGKTYGLSAFNSTGADYAEYFEWQDGNPTNEDRICKFVSLTEDGKIKIANAGEDIIGVISGISSIIGNANEDMWEGMYLRDFAGRFLYEDVEVERDTNERVQELNEDGTPKFTYNKIKKLVKEKTPYEVTDEKGRVHTKYTKAEYEEVDDLENPIPVYKVDENGKPIYVKETVIEHRMKINPDYDPTQEYIPRSQRPEWDVVGLLGQVVVEDDGTCVVGKKCSVKDGGIATLGTDYRVIKRIDATHIVVLANFL